MKLKSIHYFHDNQKYFRNIETTVYSDDAVEFIRIKSSRITL